MSERDTSSSGEEQQRERSEERREVEEKKKQEVEKELKEKEKEVEQDAKEVDDLVEEEEEAIKESESDEDEQKHRQDLLKKLEETTTEENKRKLGGVRDYVRSFIVGLKEGSLERDKKLPFIDSERWERRFLERLSQLEIETKVTEYTAPYLLKILKTTYEEGDFDSKRDIYVENLRKIFLLNKELFLRVLASFESEKRETLIKKLRREGVKVKAEDLRPLLRLPERQQSRRRRNSINFQITREEENLLKKYVTAISTVLDRAAEKVKKIEDLDKRAYLEGLLKKIDDNTFSVNISEVFSLTEELSRELQDRGIIEPLLEIARQQADLKEILSKMENNTSMFIERMSGWWFDIEALGLTPEDFLFLTPEAIKSSFSQWFVVRDSSVEFAGTLSLNKVRNLVNRIIDAAGIDPGREWEASFDRSREGTALKLVRFTLNRSLQLIDKGFFDEVLRQGGEANIEFLRNELKRRMKKLASIVDEEVNAQSFMHNLSYYIFRGKLESLEQMRNVVKRLNVDIATIMFSDPLVDIAARVFEQWLQDRIARSGNIISSELFQTIASEFVGEGRNPDLEELFLLYTRTVMDLAKDPALKEKLEVPVIENWMIERAFRLGIGRSFLTRAPGILARAEPRRDFAGLFLAELITAINPRHLWLLGRGGEKLEKPLLYLLNTVVRQDLPDSVLKTVFGKSRRKKWVPKAVWDFIQKRYEKDLDTLLEIVNERFMRDVASRYDIETDLLFKGWLRTTTVGDFESRGGWRPSYFFEKLVQRELGISFDSTNLEHWKKVIERWGTGFLHYVSDSKAEKDINSADSLNIKDKELAQKRKKLSYEGYLYYQFMHRAPIEFLNIIMRYAPGFTDLTIEGRPAYEVLFDADLGSISDEDLRKKVADFRATISEYWDGNKHKDLKQVFVTWYKLHHQVALELGVDISTSEGQKKVKAALLQASFNFTRKLLLHRKRTIKEYVDAIGGKDKLSGVEKVIYEIFYEGPNSLEGYFFNRYFANLRGDYEEKIERGFYLADDQKGEVYKERKDRNFFINLAGVRRALDANVILSTVDTDYSDFWSSFAAWEPKILERHYNDTFATFNVPHSLTKYPSVIKSIALKGKNGVGALEEILAEVKKAKGVLGSDKIYEINSVLLEKSLEFMQTNYWERILPYPFNFLARWFLGKEGLSISKIMFGRAGTSFTDTDIADIVYEFEKKGLLKEKHAEQILANLRKKRGFLFTKEAFRMSFVIFSLIVFYFLKQALEEEEKSG